MDMGSEDRSSLLIVEKSEVVLVKPLKPTPHVCLSLSTIDNHPRIEHMLKTICVFAAKPYRKDQDNYDEASLLQLALSHALVYYYPLAGKLHRKPDDNRLQLNCKAGDGVPFIRATAACTLSSLNYFEDADHLEAADQLVPNYDAVSDCEGYDPLALQVTKFACGGITIGLAHSHSVCDGVGGAHFFRALIELASGKIQPSVIPVWERERLTFDNTNDELGDANQNPELTDSPNAYYSTATSPYSLNEDMVREILNITSEDITKLKNKVAEDEQMTNEKVVVTTLEILAAHVWRARCRALKLSPDGTTVLGIIVDVRSIVEPPLPEGYYGNAVVIGDVSLTARELSDSPLSHVVRHINDMKRAAAVDTQYVSEKLKEMERDLKEKASSLSINGESLLITDWRNLGLRSDVLGGLMNVIPLVPLETPFLCTFLPALKAVPEMSDGVRVLVVLPRDAMAKFKEEMNAF